MTPCAPRQDEALGAAGEAMKLPVVWPRRVQVAPVSEELGTYELGLAVISSRTAPKVAVYSLVKQPVVVQTHWFNKVCCCTVINSVKP